MVAHGRCSLSDRVKVKKTHRVSTVVVGYVGMRGGSRKAVKPPGYQQSCGGGRQGVHVNHGL